DHGNLAANEIGGKLRQSIKLILGPAVDDRYILALDITSLFQALAQCSQSARHRSIWRPAVEQPDHRHRRLLRTPRERPCGSAAEQRDERASFHSITSSASANSLSGTVRPSALVVLRLITSSNLVSRSTGRSAGLVPWRIRAA